MSDPRAAASTGMSRPHLSGGRLLLLLAALAMPGGPAPADGLFFQLDAARDGVTAVLSVARGPLTFGATHVRTDDDETTRASVLYRVAAVESGGPFAVKLGPSLARVDAAGAAAKTRAGLRMTLDRYVVTEFGGVYLQAEVDTIDRAWFVLGQAILADPRLTLEVSRGASDTYSDTTAALSKRLGDGPASVRIGYRFEAENWFAGVSINTF